MKTRLTGILAAAALAVAALGGPVAADADLNEHNCAGWALSSEAPGDGETIGDRVQEEFEEEGPGSFGYYKVGQSCPPQ